SLLGVGGNISVDPWFACVPGNDYHLIAGSPCIDAGTNGAPLLPAGDLDGNLRVQPAYPNNPSVVDMGAFEFNFLTAPSPCPTPPRMTFQHANKTAYGRKMQTTVALARGPPPMNYQWYKGGVPLIDGDNVSGSRTVTLRFNKVQTDNAGTY